MLRAILNKSWRQHPTRHQLNSRLPLVTKTIQVRRTRHAGHCWRSKDELISDVLLCLPPYGQAKAGRPARTYIHQLCEDTGCSSEDLPEAMNDGEKWRERVRDIRASGTTSWWFQPRICTVQCYFSLYIYIYIYIIIIIIIIIVILLQYFNREFVLFSVISHNAFFCLWLSCFLMETEYGHIVVIISLFSLLHLISTINSLICLTVRYFG